MAQEILSGMSIIPTCINGSCLPNASAMVLFANALTIALLIGIARRHLRKSQA